MTRYIFISGGVVSSLGKGIAAASIAALLQKQGLSTRIRKLDGYLNVDPGTMSPYQHGEVFVTNDGTEVDLDFGHYERFTGTPHTRSDTATMGRIYSQILEKERRGDYLGSTVQVVPHVIDEIKSFITAETHDIDVVIVEVGGTVGDIESRPFLEAIRQLAFDLQSDPVLYGSFTGHPVLFIHAALIPYLDSSKELKTKAAQHSVQTLLSFGIQPHMLLCRTDRPLPHEMKKKLGLLCNVPTHNVVTAENLSSIYQVPLALHDEGLDQQICRHFHIPYQEPDLSEWRNLNQTLQNPKDTVCIGIVGKYIHLPDAYKSVCEAILHGGIQHHVRTEIKWIDVEAIEETMETVAHSSNAEQDLNLYAHHFDGCDGLIVPGGFGVRGAFGKMKAIEYARIKKVPFLGICLGMQMTVIEACRNILGVRDAFSTEFGPTDHPVVGLITEWWKDRHTPVHVAGITLETENRSLSPSASMPLGGTMRLGAQTCHIQSGSRAYDVYGALTVSERHRHRYEVNTQYLPALEHAGLRFSGMSDQGDLPEIVEYPDHPFFIAVQYHPEFLSNPFQPHPLFSSLIQHALEHKLPLK